MVLSNYGIVAAQNVISDWWRNLVGRMGLQIPVGRAIVFKKLLAALGTTRAISARCLIMRDRRRIRLAIRRCNRVGLPGRHHASLPQPVFDPEIINSQELALVVGYQRKIRRQCVSGYEQVVCANRLADLFQARSYHSVYGVDGRLES